MRRLDLETSNQIGRVWEHYALIDSTNTYLKSIADAKDVESGLVVSADYQLNGRGQQNNLWRSNAGENLLISFLLKNCSYPIDKLYLINMQVSNILFNCILDVFIGHNIASNALKIKWPNDIYFGQYKLSGMLIETALSGNLVNQLIAGIGLNSNQEIIDKGAISLSQIVHSKLDIHRIAVQLISDLDNNLLPLIDSNGEDSTLNESIKSSYFNNLLNYNQEAMYSDALNNNFKGTIIDVDTGGRLIMEVNNQKRIYNLKEVKFLF